MNNKGSHTKARKRKQKEGVRITSNLRFSNNQEECKSKAFILLLHFRATPVLIPSWPTFTQPSGGALFVCWSISFEGD